MPKNEKPQPPADWKEHAKLCLEGLWLVHNAATNAIATVNRIISNDEAEEWYQYVMDREGDVSEPPEEEKP